MIELYCTLIIAKAKSFSTVRDEFKPKVKARLLELGYDTNGDPAVAAKTSKRKAK